MKTYTARLEQEHDGRWSVELEEEPRVHTWGKTIDQALNRVREAAALWYQTDEASIELVPRPVLPKATDRTVEQARKAREQARDADRLAIEQTLQSSRRSHQPWDQHARRRCDPRYLPPARSSAAHAQRHPHAARPADPACQFTEPKHPSNVITTDHPSVPGKTVRICRTGRDFCRTSWNLCRTELVQLTSGDDERRRHVRSPATAPRPGPAPVAAPPRPTSSRAISPLPWASSNGSL